MTKFMMFLLAFGLGAAVPGLANAQAYPNKPIRMIVTFPPGGATDMVARRLGQPLSVALGQTVVVDNRPGANSIIGMEACARAAPDGYTFCMTNNDAITFNPVLYSKLPYDPAKDLYPVAKVADIEQVVVAHSSLQAATLQQAIEKTKAGATPVTFSTFGQGSMGHLYLEWLNAHANSRFVHVPYKGAAPALEAVFKGEVGVSLFGVGAALPYVKSGDLKALTVIDTKRSRHFPNTPAITEIGYDYVVNAWLGIFAPKDTPKAIVERMSAEVNKVLADPKYWQEWAAEQAISATPNTPEQFAAFISQDSKVAEKHLRAAKIKLD